MAILVGSGISIVTDPLDRTVGVSSKYASDEHLGTNRKVEGWKWDERYWPTTKEFEASGLAPSLWDPITSGLSESVFQSGYGDNKDLLLLDIEPTETSGAHFWAPKINHGHFFIYDEEWYLYGDLFQTQHFAKSMAIGGQQYLDLDYNYKPSIPIQVRRYEFNSVLGRHVVDMDFRRKIEFTLSGTEPEFRIETTVSGGPRLWLNDDWSEAVGAPITLDGSGFADAEDIQALEWLGISDGTEDQRFHTITSPIDPFEDLEVWSYFQPTVPRQWEVLSGVEQFITSGQQVHVDYDHGILSFGDWDLNTSGDAGLIPSAGERIVIHYTKGLAAFYEPEFGQDYILAKRADVNPIVSSTYRGFVHILTESTNPASITLEAELPTESPTYLISLGNNTGRLIATVKDSRGQVLEGEEVVFEILAPQVGAFGTIRREISAVTDIDGQAKAIYNAPTTTEDVGQASDNVSHFGGDTRIEVEGITDPETVSGLYLYKVHYWDPPLGIPSSGLDDYYEDYLDNEDVVSGIAATQDWEEEYRTIHELGEPVVYEDDDLGTGKKTIVLSTGKSGIIDPHSGTFSTSGLSPLYASQIEDIGTDTAPKLRLTYSGNLPLPGTEDTKAYLAVGDAQTYLRAYVINRHTNTRLYSDQVALKVSIPEALSGTYFADILSNIPSGLLKRTHDIDTVSSGFIEQFSGVEEYEGRTFHDSYLDERSYDGGALEYESYVGWFRRTRRGDSDGLEQIGLSLSGIDIDEGIEDQPGEIPLGFKLKSTGITVASALDQCTFFDPNSPLPDDYYTLTGVY